MVGEPINSARGARVQVSNHYLTLYGQTFASAGIVAFVEGQAVGLVARAPRADLVGKYGVVKFIDHASPMYAFCVDHWRGGQDFCGKLAGKRWLTCESPRGVGYLAGVRNWHRMRLPQAARDILL